MAASLFRLSRPRRVLLPLSALRLPLSTQPLPQPRDPSSPNSNRGLPAFLSFLAAAAAGGITGSVALCDAAPDHRVGGKDSTELVVRGERKRVPQQFIEELASFLGENLTVDYEERSFHGTPQNSFHKAVNVPDVVVFPKSQYEVRKIVMTCNKYKVPIVPYGGATSIEGHTLAPHGGVCIDMSSMKKIKSLHVEDMDVVVEPGVGWIELNEYLKPHGLFFPLDPGPGATIGGMCATRCSGSLAVRYGTMRDNVINLQAVLPDGDVVKTGSRARKSAAGYDLTRLIIGSEGTLGVITEVTLRLQKLPSHSVDIHSLCSTSCGETPFFMPYLKQHKGCGGATPPCCYNVYSTSVEGTASTCCARYRSRGECRPIGQQEFNPELLGHKVAMCNFQTVKDAADVAIASMHSGIQVSRVELLDEVQIRAINMANGKSLPEVPTLMFEFIGTEAYALEQTLLVQKIAAEHHGSDFVFVEEPNAKEELWKIRKEALWAGFAMKPDHEAMITDVCVPLSRLAECISVSKQLLDASPLTCLVIAHAGDGNFHTIILFDPSQEEERREAERLNHFMVHTALSMEGTCTGEHGVGTGKMKAVPGEGAGDGVTEDDEKDKGRAGSQQHHESRKAHPTPRLHLTKQVPDSMAVGSVVQVCRGAATECVHETFGSVTALPEDTNTYFMSYKLQLTVPGPARPY
ncbi:D-lactate dehydrogenase [cytochrome], mitochondrial-like isoform X1 [Triticum dicoccoides]|uniref:D-lactate dehydrogenase [cytochrome], mitochondrial-like isoform X1 n=1 Tax=Triticum dicoccoides TaxID=85692 RepID=UPI00188EA846|nr:D-lactate dehydrogenase [cytochrome], mitochondrial-like isoform X1 [Triticum dicoccoides]